MRFIYSTYMLMLVINKTSWLTRNKPQGYMGNVSGYSHKQIQTSLHSRTMGCVTATSCWLPIMALLVLLLRPWPFLKGALGPGGISLQGDVGEVDRTRVFRAATSACRTSIWTQEKEKVFSDYKLKRGLSSGIYKISHLTKTCFAFKNVRCKVMEWKKHFLLTQAPCF